MSLPNRDQWAGILTGSLTALLFNIYSRKPVLSRIYIPIGFGVVGYFVGTAIHSFKDRHFRPHNVMLEDYVQQHPDLFEKEEPLKYKDVLMPWSPTR